MIKVGLQSLAARPARTALTMLAIVLGVAMVAAAFTVTDTMRKAADALSTAAYDNTDAVVTGRTHFQTNASNEWAVEKPKVPAATLDQVRKLPQVGVAVGDITDQNTKVFDRKGDPIGDGPYFGIGYDAKTPGSDRVNPLKLVDGRWAAGPGEVVLDEGTADKADAKLGSSVRITTDRGRDYRIVGIAHFGDVKSLGTATVAAFDLATAQRELHRGDRYDDVLVGAAKGVSPQELRAALAKVVPAEATVKTAAGDDRFTFDSLKQFIDIIKVALLVFGGVAIVVGAFTIFNALSITVAQRSRELGLLRLVGASRKQVLGSVVVEALALGVLASVVGVAAGYGLAKGLTALLASMGLDLPEAGTVFAARTVGIALAVGIVVTTLAGLIPAFRATRVAPVAVLREAATKTPGRFGRLVRALVGVLGRPAERVGGTAGALARRNAMRNPGRIMSTASALTIGVALVTLVTVVAAGLKDTATSSLERRVSADHVIVSTDGWSPIDRTIVGDVAATPGVNAVSGIVQDGGKAFGDVEIVNGIDPGTLPKVFKFDWKTGTDAVPGSLGATGAIVDSGWATEHGLNVGSAFSIQSAKGTNLRLTVRGIEKSPVLDALGLGPVTIGKPAYDRAFANQRPVLTMVSSTDAAQPALHKVLAAHPDAELDTTSAWIKDRAAGVDQLVAIFGALLALAVIVSLFGIVNTLVLSTFERTRELGMLRAVGMTRRQMRRMVRHESIITALLGALTGMAIGLGLAAIVTSVFADSGLAFVVPAGTLIAFTVVAILAGVLAAVAPARRAAKLSPLAALAYE